MKDKHSKRGKDRKRWKLRNKENEEEKDEFWEVKMMMIVALTRTTIVIQFLAVQPHAILSAIYDFSFFFF